MSTNKNDMFGGFFDLNGDGKTSIDEEFIAYQIISDCNKENENIDVPFIKPKRQKTQPFQPSKTPLPEPLPNLTPKERYDKIKSSFKAEVFSCIVVSLLVLFPVIAVNWAAISTYDEKNSASGFLIAVFLIAGFVIIGCLGKALVPDLSNAYEQVNKIKNEYMQVASDDEKKMLRKKKIRKSVIVWSIVVCVFALFIILLSSTSDSSESNTTHSNKYNSYGYSSNKYSGNNGNVSARPPVNRTPAMTKEEAERLSGTGYHGCRPNSSAENTELKAAQVKCRNCGYHSDNGSNSYCDYCQWVLTHEGSLPKSNTNSSTPSSKYDNKKAKTKSHSHEDEYDVNSYSDPDDFYYDHYDDFFDYYDAEDYYNEHHK